MTEFDRRVVTIAPGAQLDYDPAAWRGAIVLVERGQVELVGLSGQWPRFVRGAQLWLDGVSLSALRNPGAEAAVLVAVARRRSNARRTG
jgi:hypothetical protein